MATVKIEIEIPNNSKVPLSHYIPDEIATLATDIKIKHSRMKKWVPLKSRT